MFSGIGWGEILVLLVVGLFIVGPERLPEAMSWVGRTIRQVKDFATGARDQLREDLGPDFEEFRKPMQELNSLRNFNPQRAIRQQFFDGDADPLGLNDNGSETLASGGSRAGGGAAGGSRAGGGAAGGSRAGAGAAGGSRTSSGSRSGSTRRQQEPLAPDEQPPVDPDAT